jgi:hypothetical protein
MIRQFLFVTVPSLLWRECGWLLHLSHIVSVQGLRDLGQQNAEASVTDHLVKSLD